MDAASNLEIEDYLDIISKVILENSILKAHESRVKLEKLAGKMPTFSKYMEKYNLSFNRRLTGVEISDDHQAHLANQIQQIRNIDHDIKKEISENKIIKLKDFAATPVPDREKIISDLSK